MLLKDIMTKDVLTLSPNDSLEKAAEQARLTKVASAYGYQDTIQKANKNDQDLANANTSIDILNQQIDDQKSYIADIQNEIKNKQNEAASQAAEQTKPINEAITKLNGDIDKLTASINDTTVSEEEKAKLKEQRDSLYDELTKKNQELSALTASERTAIYGGIRNYTGAGSTGGNFQSGKGSGCGKRTRTCCRRTGCRSSGSWR